MNSSSISISRKTINIAVGVLVMAYLIGVIWCNFTVGDKRLDEVLSVSSGHNSSCNYMQKYLLSKGTKNDANPWLLENFVEVNFDSAILTDPTCLGALFSDVSANILAKDYQSKIEMRFLERQQGNVKIRLHYKL